MALRLSTSSNKRISKNTGELKFLDAVQTINVEAEKLKSKGVNIIIVLSHCGIVYDKVIAANCPDVDVIIGGHSHILLYNGIPPSHDTPYDQYPIVIEQKESNRKVLIAHADAFTKYMGDIRIIFDDKDEVKYWKGNPIYLDSSIEEDPLIIKELELWKSGVERIGKEVIGQTLVFLNNSCDRSECNLANLITDAMVYQYKNNASISFINANSIQSSFSVGPMVFENIYMTLPYNNTWDLIELEGKYILMALEENVAVSSCNTSFVNSKLLHWSGLKVIYNLSNENEKVVSVKVRCLHCQNNEFEELKANGWYRIVISSFTVSKTIIKYQRNKISGKTTDLINFINYIKKIKVVNIQNESRMVFV